MTNEKILKKVQKAIKQLKKIEEALTPSLSYDNIPPLVVDEAKPIPPKVFEVGVGKPLQRGTTLVFGRLRNGEIIRHINVMSEEDYPTGSYPVRAHHNILGYLTFTLEGQYRATCVQHQNDLIAVCDDLAPLRNL